MSLAAPLSPDARAAAGVKPPPYEATPIALALAVFALSAFAPAVLNDGDTWSHVATGDWIIAHRAVPRADPFTFWFVGAPWTAHEWLSELLLALAHRLAGWSGVVLLTGAAAAMALYIVGRRAARDLGGFALPVLLTLSLSLLSPSLLARPHILALPVMAIWCDALFAARESHRAPPLALALLMTLWANLHGGFAFGLALTAPLALEAVWQAAPVARFEAFKDWTLFGLASLVAAAVTPFGLEGLLFPLKLMRLSALAGIKEWQPENFAHPGALEYFLLALIGLALTKPLRVSPVRAILLVGLVHLSLQHARHELLLAIVAPMLLAAPIAEALASPAAKPPARSLLYGGLALALLISAARVVLPVTRGDSDNSPMRALAAVPAGLRDKPFLNSYAFGGYLIYEGLHPYIDGRADMFGDAALENYAKLAAGEPVVVADTLDRYGIAWTIFSPNQGIVEALDRRPGWRRVYSDPRAVVHVREGEGAEELRRD